MSEAPERIWAWQSYEHFGQHGGQWCDHTKDGQEYVRADRIEELELEVETWKSRALHQNEVADVLEGWMARCKVAEAMLVKAVGALKHIEHCDIHAPTHARTTLKELTGADDAR